MAYDRDYKREYRTYHGNPSQIRKRALRNAARRKLGLPKGDPREADHKIPLKRNPSHPNSRSNLRAVSRTTNRRKGCKPPSRRK